MKSLNASGKEGTEVLSWLFVMFAVVERDVIEVEKGPENNKADNISFPSQSFSKNLLASVVFSSICERFSEKDSLQFLFFLFEELLDFFFFYLIRFGNDFNSFRISN